MVVLGNFWSKLIVQKEYRNLRITFSVSSSYSSWDERVNTDRYMTNIA